MRLPKSYNIWCLLIAALIGYFIAKGLCKCSGASAGKPSAYGATSSRA